MVRVGAGILRPSRAEVPLHNGVIEALRNGLPYVGLGAGPSQSTSDRQALGRGQPVGPLAASY
jgi:hypothetical protein